MMSSPPLSTGERLKLSNQQRRRRQLFAIASGFALLILTIVAVLFATGIFLIPTGSLSIARQCAALCRERWVRRDCCTRQRRGDALRP